MYLVRIFFLVEILDKNRGKWQLRKNTWDEMYFYISRWRGWMPPFGRVRSRCLQQYWERRGKFMSFSSILHVRTKHHPCHPFHGTDRLLQQTMVCWRLSAVLCFGQVGVAVTRPDILKRRPYCWACSASMEQVLGWLTDRQWMVPFLSNHRASPLAAMSVGQKHFHAPCSFWKSHPHSSAPDFFVTCSFQGFEQAMEPLTVVVSHYRFVAQAISPSAWSG